MRCLRAEQGRLEEQLWIVLVVISSFLAQPLSVFLLALCLHCRHRLLLLCLPEGAATWSI